MADQLLVRLFDVGLGDCIYCSIPEAHQDGRDFHILIDCGTLSSQDYLRDAIEKLKPLLHKDGEKAHIDLLVVTHEHKDHMSGFGLDIWDDISFGAIWMNTAMDPENPQAGRTKKLQAFAAESMARALQLNLVLGPQLSALAQVMAANADTMKNLRETLPGASGIAPTYVHADSTNKELALPLKQTTKIRVLGPERDVDRYYLGSPADPSLAGAFRLLEKENGLPPIPSVVPGPEMLAMPTNIDPGDFRQLRSRVLSTALAFAKLSGTVCNNTSVVLLIEWKGKRLLFVGDAEWENAFKDGKGNGAWNVIWNIHPDLLKGPLAFYKIGHHGSTNATPWGETEKASQGEPMDILNAILPIASKKTAKAVVSTRRATYETIPRSEMLTEIGARVSNTKNYAAEFEKAGVPTSDVPKFKEFEKDSFAEPQPLRTDLESLLDNQGFIDVKIDG